MVPDVTVRDDIDIAVKNIGLYRSETMLRCGYVATSSVARQSTYTTFRFHIGLELARRRQRVNASTSDVIATQRRVVLSFTKEELDGAIGDKRFAHNFRLGLNHYFLFLLFYF